MEKYDVVIRNGKVVDGTGAPWSKFDVGIRGEKIAKVKLSIAEKAPVEIDATGLMVAPGFWDLHSHDEWVVPDKDHPKYLFSKISQGITTHVVGNCGLTPFPVSKKKELFEALKLYGYFITAEGVTWEWVKDGSFTEFVNFLEKQGIICNMASLVGQGSIRISVMGFEAGDANKEQLNEMKKVTEEMFKQGVFGLTTGLIYPPGFFTRTPEIIELAKIAARYGGIYGSHLRGESETLLDSVREAIRVGEEAKIPVHIHHHEAWGPKHFWKVPVTIGMIEEARNIKGIDTTYDMFPYAGANTTISAIYPPWAMEGGFPKLVERLKDPKTREKIRYSIETGLESHETWPHNIAKHCGWDGILVIWTMSEKNKWAEGKDLAQLGKEKGKHPFDVAADLTIEENGQVMCIYFGGSATEADDWNGEGIKKYVSHPYAVPETDAVICKIGRPGQHPAGWGLTGRVLGRYARDLKLFTMEEAVRKMTSLAAHRLNIQDRGVIREGAYADITVFNPETVIDRATYRAPKHEPCEGIEYVMVNGKLVLEKGKYHPEVLAGKVIRKTW